MTVVAPGRAAIDDALNGTTRLTDRWAERHLERPPTLHLEAGSELQVVVTVDLRLGVPPTSHEP